MAEELLKVQTVNDSIVDETSDDDTEDVGYEADIHFERINIFKITRGVCRTLMGPCPHASCRFNLLSDEKGRSGSKQGNISHRDLSEPYVLTLAERGGMTLEEVAHTLGITRERVRQIEFAALRKLNIRLANQVID